MAITVNYNPELPEVKALPENIKKQTEGFESADALITTAKLIVLRDMQFQKKRLTHNREGGSYTQLNQTTGTPYPTKQKRGKMSNFSEAMKVQIHA